MLYLIGDEIQRLDISQIAPLSELVKRPEHTTVAERSEPILAAFLNLQDLKQYAEVLGIGPLVIETCEESLSREHEAFENIMTAWEDFSFGIINVLNPQDVFRERDTIGLYLRADMILIIDLCDKDDSTRQAFERCLRQPRVSRYGVPRVFNLFIRELIRDHISIYETMRRGLEKLDDTSWRESGQDKKFEEKISDYNHELLVMYSYYQQLGEVCAELEENDNELFDEDELGHIASLGNRIDRYAGNVNFLREYCQQIRESYQAQLDLYLNQIMKIFTVVTTIFLPLSIVVGWYGMNFNNMPELGWRYGYHGVIVLSVLIVSGSIYYFKKKRLM